MIVRHKYNKNGIKWKSVIFTAMNLKPEDVGGQFRVLDYKYILLLPDILVSDSHLIQFTYDPHLRKVVVSYTISVTQKLKPSVSIKAEGIFTINSRVVSISREDKLFLIREILKATVQELRHRLIESSGVDLLVPVLKDPEILKSYGGRLSDLN
jgi:hypothetical protein